MAIINSTIIQTKFGEFTVTYHQEKGTVKPESCLSISKGNLSQPNCIVRLHSACLFSESFQTIDCDCSLQLKKTMELIGKEGGVIIYLFQEGRGVGLMNKITAMELERTEGLDTVDAFKKLHFDLDPRNYTIAIKALRDLKVNNTIKLVSNNPRKRMQLEEGGFLVNEKITLQYRKNTFVKKYLSVKKDKLGHEI